jgi:hypothetical protein
MVSTAKRKDLSLEAWKKAMHTEALADVRDFSVHKYRGSGGHSCLETLLDFATRKDSGPYGYYIFYLVPEGGALHIQDVLTYSRIRGSLAEFDESREPFDCHR